MSDPETEGMTKGQLTTYNAAKVATDAVGKVPFLGGGLLTLTDNLCAASDAVAAGLNRLAGLPSHPDSACQAVKDTLGELERPTFPKTTQAAAKAPTR